MRRRPVLSASVAVAVVALAFAPSAGARDDPRGSHVRAAHANASHGLETPLAPAAQGGHRPKSNGFILKGHIDTGVLNADVWAHKKFAYLGVWSGTCPATGVKVVDYHNLRHPKLVSRLQNDTGTSAEDIVV